MTLRDESDSINALGEELKDHQALIDIVFLYDHGWQVGISNPGGTNTTYVHGRPVKWSDEGALTLPEAIAAAIAQAEEAGWW